MARTFLAVLAFAVGFAFLPSAHAVIPPLKQPAWAELTPEQKQTLSPLSGEWDRLEAWRRKKWIGIAQRYSILAPEEQARVQRRMKEWVSLEPDERKAAREKYKSLQKASPEHKEAIKQKWQEYKELPEEEKQRLQTVAKTKASTNTGAMVPAPAAAKPDIPAPTTVEASPPSVAPPAPPPQP